MTQRLAMLQTARLAPKVLGPAADAVADLLRSAMLPTGGAVGRDGAVDLYYTGFALDGLTALSAVYDPGPTAAWLAGLGDGLDLVHTASLARCWAGVGGAPEEVRRALVARLRGAWSDDVYEAFLITGALEDLGDPPTPAERERVVLALGRSRSPDGSWAGSTPVTAAAVTLLRHAGAPVPTESRRWLVARQHAQGGFVASPGTPAPDLLSTAVALHALDAASRPPPDAVRERCLDFVDSLWTGAGFCASWADEEVDVEYAFYALLALGHLA